MNPESTSLIEQGDKRFILPHTLAVGEHWYFKGETDILEVKAKDTWEAQKGCRL